MVKSCSAYGCTKRASKDSQVSFHRIPLKDKELCRKWVSAMRHVDFQPTSSCTLCSAHFLPKDYVDQTAKKQKLKETAVPSLFYCPKHLNKLKFKRKSPLKRKADINEEVTTLPKKTRFDSLKEVSPRKNKLLRRIKTLKQKVRRKKSKINSSKAALDHLEKEKLLASDAANITRQNFSGLKSELFQSELSNQNRVSKGHRYSDAIKKFALTLHFYSLRAYDYMRNLFSLPCPSSLSHWTSSVNCEPGFFKDISEYLQEKAKDDESYRDCALIL